MARRDSVALNVEFTEKDILRWMSYMRRNKDTGCLIWCGLTIDQGYGRMKMAKGRAWLVHRLAWIFAGRQITPDKPFVLHNCPGGDNTACCEVSHLWLGTHADNARDKALKGRGRKGPSGLPLGVCMDGSKFRASICRNKYQFHLGNHETAQEAAEIASAARHLDILLPHLFSQRPPV